MANYHLIEPHSLSINIKKVVYRFCCSTFLENWKRVIILLDKNKKSKIGGPEGI